MPPTASSKWAGRLFTPWWWKGAATTKPEEVHKQEEEAKDNEDIVDLFHGTEVHNIPRILSEGLRPSVTGAGAQAVQEHYGVVVPAVYVTPSFQTATHYPMVPTIEKVNVQGQVNHGSIAGGTLLADEGSFPLRCVIQLRGRRDKALWRRAKVQAQHLPKDL